jgi:AraC-like DNA-binding protein
MTEPEDRLWARFAPFIYFGGQLKGTDELRHGSAQRCCHTLWQAVDGRLGVQTPSRTFHLSPGDVALLRPGSFIFLPAGSVSRVVAFDVFWRRRKRLVSPGSMDSRKRRPAGPGHWWITRPERPELPIDALASDPLPLVLDGDRRDLAAHMLIDLLDLWWRKPGINLAVANVRLHQWLVSLLQTAASGGPLPPTTDPIERAEQYARQRFTRGISVADMAQAAGLSPSHFSRLYAQSRPQTAAEFLADLKFAEAKRLLVDTASSVDGIARASGLRNDQAMQRLFRARTGLSPRQWRTANRP